jgi:hypothetical protein
MMLEYLGLTPTISFQTWYILDFLLGLISTSLITFLCFLFSYLYKIESMYPINRD